MADRKDSKKQNAIQRYFRETLGEMRKVSWPTRQEATQLTIIVIVVMVFMGIFLGLTDVVAGRLLNLTLGI